MVAGHYRKKKKKIYDDDDDSVDIDDDDNDDDDDDKYKDDEGNNDDNGEGDNPYLVLFSSYSVPPTSLPMSREEGVARGFHPYRPEEDLHRAAAAAAVLPPYALDPAYAAYHPAFLQHHAYQSALRYLL
jgi:hypothetical protein